jgi:ABC-type amino acid transport system permease subunit
VVHRCPDGLLPEHPASGAGVLSVQRITSSGIETSVFAVGSISLSVYTAAFGAAIFEAAINSVPKGQTEAAYSQGFGFFTTMMRIVLPQALKVAIPPMTGQVVNLIKNSSVLAMVALGELMYMTDSWSAEHAIYGPDVHCNRRVVPLPLSAVGQVVPKS